MAERGAHYFPLFLDLDGKQVVVIGGGAVAERKVRSVLECGAKVTVVAPRLINTLNPEQAACMKALGNALQPHFLKTGLTQRPEEEQHAAAPSGGDEAPPEAAEPEGEESGELFENEPQAEPATS